MFSRRQIISALGMGAFAFPFASLGQARPKVSRIGFIVSTSRQRAADSGREAKFLQGMRELGYAVGTDFVTEWRSADGNYDRLPGMAAELVALKVDVIVAAGSPAIRAAQKATSIVPIVMANTGDPVGSGFAASLARPGGNITGYQTQMTTSARSTSNCSRHWYQICRASPRSETRVPRPTPRYLKCFRRTHSGSK